MSAAEPDPAGARGRLSDRGLLGLLATITALGPVSTNLYLPALPLVREYFDASVADAQTTFTIAIITFAIGVLLWGPASDRYGRRAALLTGLTIMVIGAAVSLAAQTLGWLVASRALQAFGTAAGLVVARAIVADRYPVERMARMLASLTMVQVLANSLAPVAGGYIVAALGWRSIFVVLMLATLTVGVIAARRLPETRVVRGRLPDAREMLATARVLLAKPLFVSCMVQSTVVYSTFFVFISLAPHIMVNAFARDSTEFGLYYILISIGYFLGNWSVGRLAARRGQHWMVTLGAAIQAVSALASLALALGGATEPIAIFLPMGVMAYGHGLTLPAVTATAVSLAPRSAGVASSILGFLPMTIGALALQGMANFPTDTAVPTTAFCAAVSIAGYVLVRMSPRLETARSRPIEYS